MPFIPATNVAHITLIGETDGQETVNDLFFISTAPPITALSLQTLTTAVGSWYGANIAPQLSETWAYSHARGRDLTSATSFVAVDVTNSGPGGIAGEQAPSNVAVNVVFGTGLAGRSLHGSNRVPALPNSVVTTNNVDLTFLGALLDAYDLLLAPSITLPAGWTWVMVSFFSGSFIDVDGKRKPTPRVAGVPHEIFDVFFPDDIVDSQKTRLPGHGR